jgi:hypothetical protein
MVRQGILSALTHPMAAEVPDMDGLVEMIEKDSQEQAKEAARRGTAIHAQVEAWVKYGAFEEWAAPHVTAVAQALFRLTGFDDRRKWRTEVAATHRFGFGGRIDLVSDELGWVVDLKGKEFGPGDEIRAYPEQCRQLAAYREMVLPGARTANLFISRNNPGLVKPVEHNESDSVRGWKEFVCLLTFYQVRNNLPIATGVM